jgi:hypothetical protein
MANHAIMQRSTPGNPENLDNIQGALANKPYLERLDADA